MQVSDIDSVKIYNLSAGKSLPDWLSDRKKRAILKKNVDLRKRIDLIQDFDMPGVSSTIRMSRDGQYILATGIYKPRIRCYDVNNLSLKFERCLDSEVVTFEALGDDYTKMVFLQCDRYLEFHVGHGRHYRLRVPRFGRDIAYHRPSCDLFIVGASSEVYRLNLEAGQFMSPYETNAIGINCCRVNENNGLLVVGTENGHIEAWDPRSRSRQASVFCGIHCSNIDNQIKEVPSITAINFKDGLTMAVGTSTGHIILYDIRSSKPMLVKDHMNGLPIKAVHFHKDQNYVYSLDSTALKIWNGNSGKQYTAIEGSADFNDLCVVPGTGMSLLANEEKKMQIYYIPSLGPAPRWCAFLDNLTEEMETVASQVIYDDYKFVTKQEIEALGLDHLMGTNLLRAYMHGYFVDIRLYKKAKSISDPFAFEEYKKQKIREKMHEKRPDRLKIDTDLPKVNRDLAMKIMTEIVNPKKKKSSGNLLKDDRFKALFQNPDFEVDRHAEEFRLLNPVISKLDKSKEKELAKNMMATQFELIQDNKSEEPQASDNEDFCDDSSYTSDDEKPVFREKEKLNKLNSYASREGPTNNNISGTSKSVPKFYKIKAGQALKAGIKPVKSLSRKLSKASLGERLNREDQGMKITQMGGNREMKFRMNFSKTKIDKRENDLKHKEDRKKVVRKTGFLMKPLKRFY